MWANFYNIHFYKINVTDILNGITHDFSISLISSAVPYVKILK